MRQGQLPPTTQQQIEQLLQQQAELIQLLQQQQQSRRDEEARKVAPPLSKLAPSGGGAVVALPPLSAWSSLRQLAEWYHDAPLADGETPQHKNCLEMMNKGTARWRGGFESNRLWDDYDALLAFVHNRMFDLQRARDAAVPAVEAAARLDAGIGVGAPDEKGGRPLTLPDVLAFAVVERRLAAAKRHARLIEAAAADVARRRAADRVE